MRLSDLLQESKNNMTTCQYLTNVGIKFKKYPFEDGSGAEFEFSSKAKAEAAFEELKQIKELTDNFDYSLANNVITVKIR